ncbi:MAG TPA: bifunctional homocysteine S-methyltransferase/methylenetetrahydrofolate reductase [Terriglobia bacterium]|nr:bifunctional homocysteine S-methyltransferase/methylenetetrahydrofolate reductase [Terriglobia bacterium]
MREPILQRLEKRIVVCDGAMGTMLYSKGIPLSRCYDELNLTSPQLVKDVHLGYVKAGAEMLETNTFGANRFRLEKPGLTEKVREINLAGARLAREVAGEDLYVAGAIGPLGVRIEPLGPTSLDEAREAFQVQIAALVEGGVDLIIVETMSDLQEAHQALLAARAVAPSLPVVVQMTIQDDGSTPAGTLPEDFTRKLDEWGADMIGINCSVGPATVLETLERMAPLTTRKLSAQPNAGLPRTVEGRNFYLCSPEYMANFARRFIQTGARLVGGCCGTTPEHIKAIKAAVKSLSPNPARTAVELHPAAAQALKPVPMEARSPLGEKLAHGAFPVLVEVVPPKGCDPAREIEGARYVREQGLDAVNVPDGAGATARMSALTLAAILEQRVGVDVLLHFSSRDRNVLGIQSDLLGAHALGIRNVLALTRDTTQFSSNPETHISDVDSIGLVNVLNNLNRGLDAGGNPLGTQTSFLIGVGANPQSENMDRELRRFEYKVNAGANFALALPVFDVAKLEAFLRRIEPITGGHFPVLAGIWPLTSFRNAEFLNNEVPGITIPPGIMDRMRKADTGDRARAEGVKIGQEALLEIRDMVQGVQIAAPFGRYAMAVEVAQVLRPKESLKVDG